MSKKYSTEDQLGWHTSVNHWIAKAKDFITDYTANHEIGAFSFHSVLPNDHTQNANCFYQVNKGGRYVQNQLQNMPGTIETISRFYTLKQYDMLAIDLQQECEEVYEDDLEEGTGGVDTTTSTETRAAKRAKSGNNNAISSQEVSEENPRISKYVQHIRIETPMEPSRYKAYYSGDPFCNERVMVRDKDYERLCKVEKKFSEGLYIGCIALAMTLQTQVNTHMEAQQEYRDAKLLGRVDVLVKLIMAAVITGGVSQTKYIACPISRNYFSGLASREFRLPRLNRTTKLHSLNVQ